MQIRVTNNEQNAPKIELKEVHTKQQMREYLAELERAREIPLQDAKLFLTITEKEVRDLPNKNPNFIQKASIRLKQVVAEIIPQPVIEFTRKVVEKIPTWEATNEQKFILAGVTTLIAAYAYPEIRSFGQEAIALTPQRLLDGLHGLYSIQNSNFEGDDLPSHLGTFALQLGYLGTLLQIARIGKDKDLTLVNQVKEIQAALTLIQENGKPLPKEHPLSGLKLPLMPKSRLVLPGETDDMVDHWLAGKLKNTMLLLGIRRQEGSTFWGKMGFRTQSEAPNAPQNEIVRAEQVSDIVSLYGTDNIECIVFCPTKSNYLVFPSERDADISIQTIDNTIGAFEHQFKIVGKPVPNTIVIGNTLQSPSANAERTVFSSSRSDSDVTLQMVVDAHERTVIVDPTEELVDELVLRAGTRDIKLAGAKQDVDIFTPRLADRLENLRHARYLDEVSKIATPLSVFIFENDMDFYGKATGGGDIIERLSNDSSSVLVLTSQSVFDQLSKMAKEDPRIFKIIERNQVIFVPDLVDKAIERELAAIKS